MTTGERRQPEPLSLLGVKRVQHGLGGAVLRPPAHHRRQAVAVFVPHAPLGDVEQVVPAGPQPPAEIHVFPHAQVFADASHGDVGRAPHEKVAGGHVERTGIVGRQQEPLAHVQRTRHLLVAVEPRAVVVARHVTAHGSYSRPREEGHQVAQPAGFGHAVAVQEGQDLPRGPPRAGIARVRLAPVPAVRHEMTRIASGHGDGAVGGTVVDHDDLISVSRIVQGEEGGEALVEFRFPVLGRHDHRHHRRDGRIRRRGGDIQHPLAPEVLAQLQHSSPRPPKERPPER